MTFLLTVAAAIGRFLRAIPWQLWLALALAAAAWGAVTYHRNAVKAAYSDGYQDGAEATDMMWRGAQEVAERRAQEAKAEAERKYAELAERIDDEVDKARADALGDAERWIAAHRVRPESDAGSPGGPVAPADDQGAGGGEGPGATPLLDAVIVAAEDVRICTVNTLQAEAARAWALELEGAGQ